MSFLFLKIAFHSTKKAYTENSSILRLTCGTSAKNPCSASRRNDRRIVNYITVIATQKLGKRTSKLVCSLTEIT
uniref:Uncharacterized protein n=2 Tax=Candidatus Kentrum sp. FM TaxID=2126340 RepID=A0A450WJH3_9GAMM|nr:MAG: hypothetical protein BECKFM1743A_GA0114220_105652 [Candidatus Kentron sp. FM]VFK17183.1 MAG: hypothetical protein BECKFM1743B_GA0114221_104661 [Candidatus Kentron sp. FM]